MFAIIIIHSSFIIVPFVVVVVVGRLPSLGLHAKNLFHHIVPYDEWTKNQTGFYSFFWVSEGRTRNTRPFRFEVIGVRTAGAQ